MKYKLQFFITMVIFGTIGLVRKMIPYASSIVAFNRALIGTIVLALFMILTNRKINVKSIQVNSKYLIPSGILLGFNWILLFEAYNYTSVAVATLCYYMAPIIVMITSPILLKESLSKLKVGCILIALVGMVFLSDILSTHVTMNEITGILFGLSSALFYAFIMIFNQKIKDLDAYDKTILQLGISAVVLLPYILFTEDLTGIVISQTAIIYLLIAGVIHTGLAYLLYFGSMSYIKGQDVAIMSYIDPIVAILISILFLHEAISIHQIIGAILILGSTILLETKEH